ncbi:RNA polymerase II elongation factor ELL2-like isoform X3 [Canis lupus baileyi]|uniref:OCEL domain-containing protein n=2 Tax=Canis lupus familiaris TaxID=9615 RepID=A0A8P0TE25_CANLF|nr:RNA polymerase II elongation factor ELL2-like isoform X1 [Canis lupus familiaris]XP_038320738.1 RNA polymerase II elongation factor ELL2-like isoform X1 [Canis lupus familiaris]XP_038444774.1 RNA polymerase II elongation factor ELL2-like isoform X1 [Canis lupus familiaris]
MVIQYRYDYMAAYEGRTLGSLVDQEGEVAVQEAYGLGPTQGPVTGQPMQLTGSAISAMDSFENYETTVLPQASFQFQGLEEFFTISPDDSITDIYDLDFLFSDVGEDNHQDRTPKPVSSYSPSELSCPSSMQEEPMSTPTNPCQMTEEKRTEAEEGLCNKWRRIRKLCVEKRVPVRKTPQITPDPVPERKRTAPINPAYTIRKSRATSSVHLRPCRERVIHLLALKDYRKPELLIRLQKDGVTENDVSSLGDLLQQVANVNPQTSSYTLKDDVFQELQKDWPGYSELERQSLELVLSRRVQGLQSAAGAKGPEASMCPQADAVASQEHLFTVATVHLARRKIRISRLAQAPATQGTLGGRGNDPAPSPRSEAAAAAPAPAPAPAPPAPSPRLAGSQPPGPATPSSSGRACSAAARPAPRNARGHRTLISKIFGSRRGRQVAVKTFPSLSIQLTYPERMQGSQATTQDHQSDGPRGQVSEPRGQGRAGEHWGCSAPAGAQAVPEVPGYLATYVTIVSPEQRQRYEQDFRAEYDDYQALYNKMLSLSSIFIDLDTQRKRFPPESKEYQEINETISLEYQKMKQRNPNYCAEKQKCQDLYDKLVHIKRLVNEYDQKHRGSQH